MTIGERIKSRRKELNISVDKLADILGKNRATIYRYESDDIENLPIPILEPLAKALHTTPAYLMGWDEIKEGLDKLEHDLNTLDTKIAFYTLLERIINAFGYEIEDNFATDKDGNTTVLFENIEKNSEKFEIKESDYNEFRNNVFSFIEFGFNKLIDESNRVKSKFFIDSFSDLNTESNITPLPEKKETPDYLQLQAARPIPGVVVEDSHDQDIMDDPDF